MTSAGPTYIQSFNYEADSLFINLTNGIPTWIISTKCSLSNILFLTHVTDDGKVYYENVQTKEVTWKLPNDERIVHPKVKEIALKIMESSRDESEKIIGEKYDASKSEPLIQALQQFCDGLSDDTNPLQNMMVDEDDAETEITTVIPDLSNIKIEVSDSEEDNEKEEKRNSKNIIETSTNFPQQQKQNQNQNDDYSQKPSVSFGNRELPSVLLSRGSSMNIQKNETATDISSILFSKTNQNKWKLATMHVSIRYYLCCVYY
jgi:hypothetical protein